MLGHHLSLLKEEKSNVEVILETIHEDINMERPDLRTSLPELRNRGTRLLDTYMDSIKSQVDSLSYHRSEYASVASVLLREGDDMVDSYNEMIRRSNTALMDIEWYEETTTADPGDAPEQPAAKMRHMIPPPNTDLKVKSVKHELHDAADYSPIENAAVDILANDSESQFDSKTAENKPSGSKTQTMPAASEESKVSASPIGSNGSMSFPGKVKHKPLATHTGRDSSTDMYTASESQESPGSRIQTMPAVPKDQMFLATSTSCNISRVPPVEDKSTDWDSFTAENKDCKLLKSASSRTQAQVRS